MEQTAGTIPLDDCQDDAFDDTARKLRRFVGKRDGLGAGTKPASSASMEGCKIKYFGSTFVAQYSSGTGSCLLAYFYNTYKSRELIAKKHTNFI